MHTKTRFPTQRRSDTDAKIHHGARKSSKFKGKSKSFLWTSLVLLLGIVLIVWYFRIDNRGQVSHWIQALGPVGVVVAIFLMALFCVLPVPSEFLMIMNMRVFGVWWGIFYTWIGAMVGALAVFYMARYFGSRWLHSLVAKERLEQVDRWVERRGAIGLLLARMVPLPFIVVNYAAGVMRSVKAFDYAWTTGIGLLPYDIGAALVFLGVSKRFTVWFIVGALAVVLIWLAGYWFSRHVDKPIRRNA